MADSVFQPNVCSCCVMVLAKPLIEVPFATCTETCERGTRISFGAVVVVTPGFDGCTVVVGAAVDGCAGDELRSTRNAVATNSSKITNTTGSDG